MPKITRKLVADAKPEARARIIWDSEIKGFGLLVLPSGVRSFVYQYRNSHGRSRRYTIGRYSDTLTADQARNIAKDLAARVRTGDDPLQEKRKQREALTVSQVLDFYLASEKFKEKTGATQKNDRGRINRHLKPTLGRIYMDDLTSEDVRRAFGKIRDGKTAADEKTGNRGRAIVRGGPGAARMAIRVLRAAISWAISEGYAKHNPAKGVSIGHDGQREATIETAEEYAQLFRAIEKLENEKQIRESHADAIRVIALTGARRSEIVGLRWKHVNLRKGVAVLPKHKTKDKTGKDRVIGLPSAAQAIITKQPEGKPDDLVFKPARGEGAASLDKAWRKIRTEAKLRPDLGLHGLRHSLATWMALQGAQAAEIMAALGHSQITTSQKYIHWAQDKRAALAEKASAHIAAAMQGNAPAEVVKLEGGRHG